MSFKEYLLGREGQNEEETVKGYRTLVDEQQRLRRSTGYRRDERRRTERGEPEQEEEEEDEGDEEGAEQGLWSKVVSMFQRGSTSFGRFPTGHHGYGSTSETGHRRRIRPDNTRTNREGGPLSSSSPSSPRRKPRRMSSRLSIAHHSDVDHDVEADDERDELGVRIAAPSKRPSNRRAAKVDKSEEDVIFGPAPGRWIKIEYWRARWTGISRSMMSCFRTEEEEGFV